MSATPRSTSTPSMLVVLGAASVLSLLVAGPALLLLPGGAAPAPSRGPTAAQQLALPHASPDTPAHNPFRDLAAGVALVLHDFSAAQRRLQSELTSWATAVVHLSARVQAAEERSAKAYWIGGVALLSVLGVAVLALATRSSSAAAASPAGALGAGDFADQRRGDFGNDVARFNPAFELTSGEVRTPPPVEVRPPASGEEVAPLGERASLKSPSAKAPSHRVGGPTDAPEPMDWGVASPTAAAVAAVEGEGGQRWNLKELEQEIQATRAMVANLKV